MTRALLLSAIVLGVTSAIPMLAAAQCGNGTIDGAEACDDGNTDAGDGCASACTVEAGFACARQTAVPLINASFDLPITAGSTGWVLAAGTIDQISNACLPADDGTLAVDMNGSSRGEIHQDIPTVVGRTYVMTLRGSANCVESAGDPCSSTCVKRLTISAADTAIPTAPYHGDHL
jgi:cysteine-rich repeat protein